LRAPVDAPAEDFIWTVSGEGAAFESDASNKLIFDDEPFEGKKKITLSVRARYPLYQSIVPSASYTMTLVDSVNVGNLADFGRLAAEGYGLALTADIPVTTEYMDSFGPESVKRGTEIKKNLYGNGFAVYRALLSNNEHVGWANSIIKILTDNVTLENTTIRYGITDDAVSREKGSRAYLKFRWALRIANDNDTQRALKNINVRYCTVENAYNIVVSQHVDVHFKGSIIRNSPSSCLLIYSALPESGLTILEDMVFSNSTGIPINMMNDVGIICDNLEDIKSIYNCELNRLEMRGFVDIYNWKDAEKEGVQLFTVSDAIANHVGVDATTLQGIVDTLLTYLLKFDPAYESLRYIINDRMYFHTGIFVMGGTSPADINTITGAEQAGYTIHAVPVPDVVIGFEPTFSNICYLVSYDKERYAVGPDDIVDYSEDSALYSELRNGRK
jgi:hypothetical protein